MTPTSPFADRLAAAVKRVKTPVLVGLDPRKNGLPEGLLPTAWGDEVDAIAQAYRSFCYGVIDVVAPLVAAVKPQVAFFEQLGPTGMRILTQVVRYARDHGLLVILDSKRADIGTTAEAYASGSLGPEGSAWRGDAMTVNPFLGHDSLNPFLERAAQTDCGIFVLCKTSNPGGAMIQDLVADGKPVYRHIAEYVEEQSSRSVGASGYGPVGAVVGATHPEQLAELRSVLEHAWLLIPGFGAQGGTAKDVAAGFADSGLGAIVNSSRGIIFAHQQPEYRDKFGDSQWQRAVEESTRSMIEMLRNETNAGRL